MWWVPSGVSGRDSFMRTGSLVGRYLKVVPGRAINDRQVFDEVYLVNDDGTPWTPDQPENIADLITQDGPVKESLSATYALSLGYVFPEQHGAVGDGVTDDTAAFNAAVTAATATAKAKTIYLSAKTYKVSAAIDLKGASLIGVSRYHSTILADGTVGVLTKGPWSNGALDNDAAILYALNKSNWSVQNVGIDASWTFASGVSAVGGDRVAFQNNLVKNSGKCAFQFLGNRHDGDLPVTNSIMQGNLAEHSIWSYVMDGTNLDNSIVGNVSVNAVQRHISVDPNEAGEQNGTGTIRGLVVSANTCRGWLAAPAGKKLTGIVPDGAIATHQTITFGTITNNSVHNWGENLPAFRMINFNGVISGNFIQNDGTSPRGGIALDIKGANGLIVTGNVAMKYTTAIDLDTSPNVTVKDNRITDTTTKYVLPATLGAGTVVGPDYTTGDIGGRVNPTDQLDTGWRDVSSWIGASFELTGTRPRVHLRRVGKRVMVAVKANPAAAAVGTNRVDMKTLIQTITAQFAPDTTAQDLTIAVGQVDVGGGTIYPAYISATTDATRIYVRSTTGTWAASDSITMTASWFTTAAWPTGALPGTAVA